MFPELCRWPDQLENDGVGAIRHVEDDLPKILRVATAEDRLIAVRQGPIPREIVRDAVAWDIDPIVTAPLKSSDPDDLLDPKRARVVRHAK